MSAAADRAIEAGARERRRIRAREFCGPTAGLAAGNVQANLVILPMALAHDFLRFAQANPKPCPVLAVSEPGDPRLPSLGEDLDIRTDVPRYRVWRDGEVVEEPTDIMSHWRDDLVAFVLGCSFSFEEALIAEGLPIRHIERIYRIGEFGAHLILANDWADWAQTKRSYELIARYVMPHFNNGFATRRAVYDFNLKNREVQLAALEEGIRTTNEQHQQHRVVGNPLPPADTEAKSRAKK